MANLVLEGTGHMSLRVDRGCLVLELRKISEQTRVIPIRNILSMEVARPQDNHRGYFYFRTPVANKPIKPSITGRDYAADDDMIFFNDEDGYKIALAIQDYVIEFLNRGK